MRQGLASRSAQNHYNSLMVQAFGRLMGWERSVAIPSPTTISPAAALRGMGMPSADWVRLVKVTIARNPFDRALQQILQ